MNFEIRIFANPSGFQEMKITDKYSLFTSDIADKRNFDGERGEFPKGTFSVYFTPKAYIIAYHFQVPSDAGFRDPETIIAVAIQRGFKMLDPTGTFNELVNECVRIVVESKAAGAANKIFNSSDKFYSIVSPKIVEDSLQFKYNTISSKGKRAILSVDKPEQRDMVLSDPFRKELKDIDILFIINREDRSKVNNLVNNGYTAIARIDYLAPRTFTLVYPDGHKVGFTDLNQELPAYEVPTGEYEKPLRFSGSVGENMEKWKITVSQDNTEFRIGLSPEKNSKTYKVVALDQDVHNLGHSLIRVKIGKLKDDQLTLEGAEIGDKNKEEKYSIQGYKIESITNPDDSTICIRARKLYTFNLSNLFQKDALGPNASVTLYRKSTKKMLKTVNRDNATFDIEYPYTDLYVTVPETANTEKSKLEFTNEGMVSLESLKKKEMGEITISFDRNLPIEVKNKLIDKKPVGKVVCKYILNGYADPTTEETTILSLPIVIQELPRVEMDVKVEFNGYNVLQDKLQVNLKSDPKQKMVCQLNPTIATLLKRYCKRNLPIFAVGLVFGVLAGLWIANTWGSFLPSIGAMSDQIKEKSEENSKLREENKKLKEVTEKLNPTVISLLENQPEANTGVGESTGNGEQEPAKGTEPEGPTLTSDQIDLIKKLKGVEFTEDDINKAKSSLKGKGQDGLIADAAACLMILNLQPSDKDKVSKIGTAPYNLHYMKLNQHKSTMDGIINSEEYKTCSKTYFKTIKEMKDYIDQLN